METTQTPDKTERFVAHVLDRCARDTGFAARLRRADNPDTEYQSYAILAAFGVDIEKDHERLPFALVGAALARLQSPRDGAASLGRALKSCFEDGEQGDPRLRRLLACDRQDELCRILRPLLSLLASKGTQPLCHARLLRELLAFNLNAQRVKLGWAKAYYGDQADAAAPREPLPGSQAQER